MNVALSELPDFTCLPRQGRGRAPPVRHRAVADPGLHGREAYRDAKATGISKRPIVEILIPSTLDDSLAPPGQHVASLFCQQFAWDLPTAAAGTTSARPRPT